MAQRGEAVFSLLLLAAAIFLSAEAYGIDGIGNWDSAGSIPLISTAAMVLTAGFVAVRSLVGQRTGDAGGLKTSGEPDSATDSGTGASADGADTSAPLLSIDLIGVLLLLVAYVVAIGYTGFYPASLVFVAATIWFLQRGRPVQATAIALLCVVAIYAAFETFFQVRLP